MSAVDTVRYTWDRFVDWRRCNQAKRKAWRDVAFMTSRDFADIGVSRATLEFELNSPCHFH